MSDPTLPDHFHQATGDLQALFHEAMQDNHRTIRKLAAEIRASEQKEAKQLHELEQRLQQRLGETGQEAASWNVFFIVGNHAHCSALGKNHVLAFNGALDTSAAWFLAPDQSGFIPIIALHKGALYQKRVNPDKLPDRSTKYPRFYGIGSSNLKAVYEENGLFYVINASGWTGQVMDGYQVYGQFNYPAGVPDCLAVHQHYIYYPAGGGLWRVEFLNQGARMLVEKGKHEAFLSRLPRQEKWRFMSKVNFPGESSLEASFVGSDRYSIQVVPVRKQRPVVFGSKKVFMPRPLDFHQPFTIEFNLYLLPPGKKKEYILLGGAGQLEFVYRPEGARFICRWGGDGTKGAQREEESRAIVHLDVNTWHRIRITYKAEENKLLIFSNGKASWTHQAVPAYRTPCDFTPYYCIGGNDRGDSSASFGMSELRFWQKEVKGNQPDRLDWTVVGYGDKGFAAELKAYYRLDEMPVPCGINETSFQYSPFVSLCNSAEYLTTEPGSDSIATLQREDSFALRYPAFTAYRVDKGCEIVSTPHVCPHSLRMFWIEKRGGKRHAMMGSLLGHESIVQLQLMDNVQALHARWGAPTVQPVSFAADRFRSNIRQAHLALTHARQNAHLILEHALKEVDDRLETSLAAHREDTSLQDYVETRDQWMKAVSPAIENQREAEEQAISTLRQAREEARNLMHNAHLTANTLRREHFRERERRSS